MTYMTSVQHVPVDLELLVRFQERREESQGCVSRRGLNLVRLRVYDAIRVSDAIADNHWQETQYSS